MALEHLGDKSEPEAWREAGLPLVCRVSPQQPRQDRGRTTPPGNQLPHCGASLTSLARQVHTCVHTGMTGVRGVR